MTAAQERAEELEEEKALATMQPQIRAQERHWRDRRPALMRDATTFWARQKIRQSDRTFIWDGK